MIRFDKEQKDSVRIALNASFLQRLVGTGYYFYDDISVPIVQQEGSSSAGTTKPLLAEYEYGNSSTNNNNPEIRRLWLLLCSRLAQNEEQYQHGHQKYLAIFLILWLIAITLLLVLISDVYELPPILLLLIPALFAVSTKWVFICLPEKHGIHFTKVMLNQKDAGLEQEEYFQQIQSMVDDLAPSFAEIGYTLDYVEDFRSNCPFLAYIRMTAPSMNDGEVVRDLTSSRDDDDDDDDGYVLVADEASSNSDTGSSSSSSSPSLSEQLRKFQWEAWDEHAGQIADQIQDHYRTKKTQKESATLLGISLRKIASCRTVIVYATIPIGFFWICINSGFLSSPTVAVSYVSYAA